jgi:hypothetical protein
MDLVFLKFLGCGLSDLPPQGPTFENSPASGSGLSDL